MENYYNSQEVFHYDTGYEMESKSWGWSEQRKLDEVENIKVHLGIEDNKSDAPIMDIVECATDGGQLVVFFRASVQKVQETINNPEIKSLDFSKAHIGIADMIGGSGHAEEIFSDFSVAFNPENIFKEKDIKYNFSFVVCGMYEDWCASTSFRPSRNEVEMEVATSPTSSLIKSDKEYQEIFDSGSCSVGDADIRRHRNTVYINNYPCGTRCNDCYRFWID